MTFVALAYGFIWLSVFGYVALVSRRVRHAEDDLDDLNRRLQPRGTAERSANKP